MHEASLVTALLRQVAELAQANDHGQIVEIRVEVGPLSGVEPVLLHEAFERLKVDTIGAAAKLSIDAVDLSCLCLQCGQHYTTPTCEFVCPMCQSPRVQVTGGDALLLESVTFATHDEVLPA
jgi:hydrogenase nickel incorporation protein HypA/HybF